MDLNNISFLSTDSGIQNDDQDGESNLEKLCEWIDNAYDEFSNNQKISNQDKFIENKQCFTIESCSNHKKSKKLLILLSVLKKNSKLLIHYKKIIQKQKFQISKIKDEKIIFYEKQKSESIIVHFLRFFFLFIFFYVFAPIKIFEFYQIFVTI